MREARKRWLRELREECPGLDAGKARGGGCVCRREALGGNGEAGGDIYIYIKI